jgi:hypothetical protein
MIYASPTWEYAADAHLLKLQCLQNRGLSAIDNFKRCIPAREMHMTLKIPYVYDYVIQLCKKPADVIQNHVNHNVLSIGQKSYIGSIRGGGQASGRSGD